MPAKVMLLAIGLGVGGTESHILDLASRIDRSRFEVIVCALKPGGRVAEELRARGVRVVSLNGAGKLDVRVLFRLLKLIQTERPDVIQAFLFWANVAARVCGRILRVFPVISSYHDEIVSEGWLVRLIDRLTLKWTDGIVCCSEAVRRSVLSRIGETGNQFTVIPFGIDVDRFKHDAAATRRELGLQDGGLVIGTVCRLVEPKKGLSVLIRAMDELKRRNSRPPCQLLIVGDGPAREELESLRDRLGLFPWVVFARTRRDIPRILHALDAFVLPSLYEGFGIAILEAMAAGKPVIATAVGGIPEFVVPGETGVLVAPGNASVLADAIERLLGDAHHAKQMGAKGRARAQERYGIAGVVRRHEQVYEACLATV
ncbi:MAG: glycosyltransferase [Nitrospira sp.]|nr:glycosyltransferase [Nitrospira sp.]